MTILNWKVTIILYDSYKKILNVASDQNLGLFWISGHKIENDMS